MAITSIGYEGSVDEVAWAKLAPALGVDCAVITGLDASIVSTTDRTVRLTAGSAVGWGVHDTSDATADIQCPVIGSGIRWDTIVIRRTWADETNPGFTSLVAVQGTSAKAIAAGVQNQPGIIADHPLFLVRLTGGQSLVQEIFDVRVWAGSPLWRAQSTIPAAAGFRHGQVLVQNVGGAPDVLVRQGIAGTETWTRLLGPKWVNMTLATGMTAFNAYIPRYTLSGGKVHIEGIVKRTSGGAFTAGSWLLTTLPIALAPDRPVVALGTRVMESGSIDARVTIDVDGTINLESSLPTATTIRFDNISFFPKGS